MIDRNAEVRRLMAEMLNEARNMAATVEDMRDTIEVAAIVRQIALPTLADDTPPSFVPAIARATLLGAWVQHDINQRGLLRAA